MEGIMKIVKSFEELCLLIKGVSKSNENETKEQKGGFGRMLLGILAASLLGILLTGKGITWAGERTITGGQVLNTISSFT